MAADRKTGRVYLSVAQFGVDAFHPDPVAAIGIDPGGGWALFGGEPDAPGPLSPTMIVHLAAPGQLAVVPRRPRRHSGAVLPSRSRPWWPWCGSAGTQTCPQAC